MFSLFTHVGRTAQVTAIVAGFGALFACGQASQAGVNVSQSGDTLSIVGNNFDNYVALIGGKYVPYGQIGVRTNPNSDTFIAYEDVVHIEIDLQGGDNLLVLDRVRIEGDLTFTAGDGDNELLWGGHGYGTSEVANIGISTGNGRDWVSIKDAYVDGVVGISTMGERDVVLLDSNLVLVLVPVQAEAPQRNESFRTNELSGGRTVEGPNDLTSDRSDDRSPPPPSNFFGSLFIETGDDRDFVGISRTVVDVETSIELGSEDDRLNLPASSQFFGDFLARGNQGQDYLYNDPTNYFESTPQFQQFELP